MNSTVPLLTVHREYEAAIEEIAQVLISAGLQVARSFEVNESACAVPHQPCPHHATMPCACRLAILYVYGAGRSRLALAVHGDGERTSFALVESSSQPAVQWLEQVVVQALVPSSLRNL